MTALERARAWLSGEADCDTTQLVRDLVAEAEARASGRHGESAAVSLARRAVADVNALKDVFRSGAQPAVPERFLTEWLERDADGEAWLHRISRREWPEWAAHLALRDEGAAEAVAGYAIVTKDGFISEYTKDDDQAYARKLPDETVITLYTRPAPAGKVRVTEAMETGALRAFYGERWNSMSDGAKESARNWMRDALEAALAAQPAAQAPEVVPCVFPDCCDDKPAGCKRNCAATVAAAQQREVRP